MNERFAVEARGAPLDRGPDAGIVFHGVNKSGSLAMAKVIGEGLAHEGRGDEFLSHYHRGAGVAPEAFRARVEARTGRFVAVGHGLHGMLRAAPGRVWVTQFRHPLPRVVSAHQWLKRKHEKAHGTAAGFPDLAGFVRAGGGVAHAQVAQFARRPGDPPGRLGLAPEALYERSVEAVERDMACIGIAERFEESIFCFAALCGIGSVVPWTRDNRNRGRPLAGALAQADRDLIREVYAWDFALYDWAVARFEAQVAQIVFGPSLCAYEAACADQYRDRLAPGEDGAPPLASGRDAGVPTQVRPGLRRFGQRLLRVARGTLGAR